MSFMSMLQMAKGKEPDPADSQNQANRHGSGTSGQQPVKAKPANQVKPKPPSYNLYTPSSKPIATQHTKPVTAPSSRAKPMAGQSETAARPSSTERRQLLARKSSLPDTAARRQSNPETQPRKQTPRPQNTAPSSPAQGSVGASTKKKLSFKDMMKRASEIDKSKLAMNLRVATNSKNEKPPRGARTDRLASPSTETSVGNPSSSAATARPSRPQVTGNAGANRLQRESAGPPGKGGVKRSAAPAAQPFPELAKKLEKRQQLREKARRKNLEDSDEDLDDFVVSEEEDDLGRRARSGDNREDIWSLFNRKPRSYYMDSGSDDEMEAKGADIIDEERQSAAFGRREDIEEERRLEELARKKKMRKLG